MKSARRNDFAPLFTGASARSVAANNAKSRSTVRAIAPISCKRESMRGRDSADQIDPAGLFLQVEVSDQFMYEKEHLLMGLTYALAKAARADRSLHDQDLIAALSVSGEKL